MPEKINKMPDIFLPEFGGGEGGAGGKCPLPPVSYTLMLLISRYIHCLAN